MTTDLYQTGLTGRSKEKKAKVDGWGNPLPPPFAVPEEKDRYLIAPLSILRSGASELEMLEGLVSVGLMNAGLGYRERHGILSFAELVKEAKNAARRQGEAKEPEAGGPVDLAHWEVALAGSHLVRVSKRPLSAVIQKWQELHRDGEVFFKIRLDLFWSAVYSARQIWGGKVPDDFSPLSFREFRLLAAILSAPVNRHGFTFISWESIQARASGYKSKADFAARPADALPDHCPVLSRRVIRGTLERMEALRFFARFRYANGERGGLFAYSFRHPDRQSLADAIGKWRAETKEFAVRVADHRSKDRHLSEVMGGRRKIGETQRKIPGPQELPDLDDPILASWG